MGQGVLAASSASGASTFVTPEDAIHAKVLSRASALGSDGQNVSVGRCVAKCTMCSPVPLAISSTNPFGGRTARARRRGWARDCGRRRLRRGGCHSFYSSISGETLTVGALSYPRIGRSGVILSSCCLLEGESMIGMQVASPRLFYDFCLDDHVPCDT